MHCQGALQEQDACFDLCRSLEQDCLARERLEAMKARRSILVLKVPSIYTYIQTNHCAAV